MKPRPLACALILVAVAFGGCLDDGSEEVGKSISLSLEFQQMGENETYPGYDINLYAYNGENANLSIDSIRVTWILHGGEYDGKRISEDVSGYQEGLLADCIPPGEEWCILEGYEIGFFSQTSITVVFDVFTDMGTFTVSDEFENYG